MEATSIYHELLAKYLFDEGYQVSITNPARARYFAQSMSKLNKTDKVDSEVLARFAMTPIYIFGNLYPNIFNC